MRSTPVLLAVFMLASAAALARQDTNSEKPRFPKSGDNVLVKGCLRGGILESTEIGVVDRGDPLPSVHTFQLKGKKDLLKKLRDQHDGYLVDVTGVLKSELMNEAARGTRVGRTRIVVGVDSSTRGGPPVPYEALPVLEVKSFEGFPTSCRR